MKPVELEIIMRDSTRQGMQSVEGNVETLENLVRQQITLINQLEKELKQLQVQYAQSTGPMSGQTENIAMTEALKNEIEELKLKLIELEQVKKKGGETPLVHPSVPRAATSQFNGLGMSIQQVARELPSLTMGANMFFLAISNNLPILADNLRMAKAEVKAMNDAGQKTTPVWKQVITSVFSWQTAMVAGITLLTLFGKEIGEWVKGMFKSKEALDTSKIAMESFATAQKKLNEQLQQSYTSYGTQRVVLENLRKEWSKLGGELNGKKKFIADNKTAFDQLNVSVTSVHDAESLLVSNTGRFIEAMKMRAMAIAAQDTVKDLYAGQLNAQKNAEDLRLGAKAIPLYRREEAEKLAGLQNSANANAFVPTASVKAVSGDEITADQVIKKWQDEKETEAKEQEAKAEKLGKQIDRVTGLFAKNKEKSDKILKEIELEPSGRKGDKKEESDYGSDGPAAAELRARQKIEAMKIALTQEGAAREKAESRARLDAELARIDAEEKERMEALKKAKKAGLPVSEEQVATVTDQSGKQREGATDIYIKEFFDIEKKSAAQEKALWDEVNLHFASGLDQRLAEIDRHYDEQVKKAEGNKELIDALNRNRETDKDIETKNTGLDSIDNAEQIELQRQAIATQGLNMDELVEQQRTDILLKYARQRIAILATMTDERSRQEKAQLEATVEALEKDKKKPKSVKGFFDEKAMNSLMKHYQKLGLSEEEATEKAQDFATTFQGRMQTASEVVGSLKSAFGGLDEGLDKAMDAVGSVVDGFANGGMIGGISAAAGQVISITAGLIGAKKEMDAGMVANYETWMEAMNDLIDKQISLLDRMGGDKFGANIKKTTEDISKQIAASRKLLGEAADAGSSKGSHSYGYRMNRMLKGYKDQLREVGIYTQDWGQMTDDQLVKLREIPDLWAHIPEEMRKYIEALAEGKEKMEEFKQTVQDTVLGFDFSDITAMIVDSMTDPSIDNALGALVENVDGAIATIVKNMLARNMLVEPVQKMVNALMASMTKTRIENGQEVTYYDLEEEAAKRFADGVTSLGSEYKEAYDKLKEQFAAAGIDFDGADKEESSSQSGRAGAITTVTEETAGKLEGIGSSIQTHVINMDDKLTDISKCAYEAIGVLGKIAENTAYCKYLEQLADDSAYQRREGTKLR